jgi:hypothetical protein
LVPRLLTGVSPWMLAAVSSKRNRWQSFTTSEAQDQPLEQTIRSLLESKHGSSWKGSHGINAPAGSSTDTKGIVGA